ncbi:MAG: winged helix-turn-helix transcriptional regulator [Candidatus Verstraetearchaeota archaeon]|nr:winged helix-turn-helix transcriptional regulator [Candidatus Verstraetearchaeota archaeon]
MKPGREEVLRVLEEAGEEGVPQSELSRLTSLSRSYVAELLKELEREGVVRGFRIGRRSFIVKLSRMLKPVEKPKVLELGVLRASEYVFLPLWRRMVRERGLDFRVTVYEDALTLTRDLAAGRLHLALSPLYTQVAVYSLTGGLKVIGGGSLGGAALVVRETLKDVRDVEAIATTKVSTMEFLLGVLAVSELRGAGLSIKYIDHPEDAFYLLKRRLVDAVNMWEPYSSMLVMKGYRRGIDYSELVGSYYCCTLAASATLSEERILEIRELYEKAIGESRGRFEDCAEQLALMIDLPADVVKRTAGKYGFLEYIDLEILRESLKHGPRFLVNLTSAREALYSV